MISVGLGGIGPELTISRFSKIFVGLIISDTSNSGCNIKLVYPKELDKPNLAESDGILKSNSNSTTFLPESAMAIAKFTATKDFPSPDMEEVIITVRELDCC